MLYALEFLSKAEQRLLQLLVTTSFRASATDQFRLSSGRTSRFYVDCKMVLSYPEARALIGKLMVARFQDTLVHAQAIGGLELSAYPLAIAVSDVAYGEMGHLLRAFIVRKEPKRHGLTKQLEGLELYDGTVKKVLVVDDVITTGESTMKAIEQCREAGLEVMQALALIDREEDRGRQRIESAGVPFAALFTLGQLAEFKDQTEA